MHVLLDTNILVSFISDPNEEYLIDKLSWLIDSGHIELLVPEILMKEWVKKKEYAIKKKEAIHKEVNETSHNKNLKDELKDELRILNEKIDKTESLLTRGRHIKLTNTVKILTSDRRTENLPPFRPGNKTSYNDGLIFFSAVEYMRKNRIHEYCFITKDRDFSYEKMPSELDPSLQVKGLDVYYGSSLEKLLREFKAAGKIQYGNKPDETDHGLIIWILPQKDKSLLDYLYEVIVVCQHKMRMIPPNIFCRIHPFRIANLSHNYTYYSHYTLFSNNSELLDFFSAVDIAKLKFRPNASYSNTKSNIKKLRYIIEILNRQFVFKINLLGSNKKLDIKSIKEKTCNCTRCLYQNLRWKDILASNYSSDDPFKMAFANYQLGFYAKAFKGYYAFYQKAKTDDNKILAYQLQWMLKWIGHNIFSKSDQEISEIKKEVEEWDNQKQYFSFSQAPTIDREIACFFQSENFINSFASDIKKLTDQIQEHYNSQLRSFVSNNSNYWNISTEFSTFIEFTFANGMAYTQYSEFLEICKNFTKSIFLSYALNEYQPSRLTALTDFELVSLLKYGNADEMLKLYTRYIKKKLLYKSDHRAFYKLVRNFLSNGSNLIIHLEETNEWQSSARFYTMLWNLILLLSIVKFNKKFVSECFDQIFPYLETLPKRERNHLNHLASLIETHGVILGKERVRTLFKLFISNNELHNDEIFDAFSVFTKKTSLHLIETENEFKQFCQLFLDKCVKCQNYHHRILFDAFEILSPVLQKKLSVLIEKKLRLEQNFELYYLSSIKDIIDFSLFFEDYLKLFDQPSKQRQHPFSHLDAEITHRELNNLINLVFKNDIPLSKAFIEKMKGISDYYDWLIDMRNFDYKKFNPLWINQYPTRYYLSKIFSIDQIRKIVRVFLITNHQPTLAYYYTQYVT